MTQESTKPTLYVVVDSISTHDGEAIAEYHVDINYNLQGSYVSVSYATTRNTQDKHTAAIKVPKKFIEQLQTIPKELWGVPIELLIKLAHNIKHNAGKSVLEQDKPKLILPE